MFKLTFGRKIILLVVGALVSLYVLMLLFPAVGEVILIASVIGITASSIGFVLYFFWMVLGEDGEDD